MRTRAAVAAAMAAWACGSDGQVGDRGLVRFSLLVDFAETEGLEGPVAAGSTLLVALQHPDPLADEPPTYTELTLETTTDSGDDPVVYPVGVAQYGVFFPSEGTYHLVARRDGRDLDRVRVVAVDPDQLDFASNVDVRASGRDGCSRSRTCAPRSIDLAHNETAELSVVPRAKGKPLVGMLQLTATVGDGARLEAPLLTPGGRAHRLLVSADGGDRTATLVVRDEGHSLETRLAVKVRDDDEDVYCR